ncbi:unnamed protein product [Linum trigynum]|uniref:Pentatricopeptide repeat-containing protein n=1 Tax=Linum trigynum TaxID=586398 RepID=A0AAV2G3E0_9ROSI
MLCTSGYVDEATRCSIKCLGECGVCGIGSIPRCHDTLLSDGEDGVIPYRFTFQAVHRDLVRLGFGEDGFVRNAVVDMFAKFGDIVKAQSIFNKIGHKDTYLMELHADLRTFVMASQQRHSVSSAG